VVEQGLGLDPNNAADGALDLDGDGMSNRAEYLAGTDPASNLSYLRINQGPGASTVSVAAVSNRTYTVQFTDNLMPDGSVHHWLDLSGTIANDGAGRVVTVHAARRFTDSASGESRNNEASSVERCEPGASFRNESSP
jgi:hypothetical protein